MKPRAGEKDSLYIDDGDVNYCRGNQYGVFSKITNRIIIQSRHTTFEYISKGIEIIMCKEMSTVQCSLKHY